MEMGWDVRGWYGMPIYLWVLQVEIERAAASAAAQLAKMDVDGDGIVGLDEYVAAGGNAAEFKRVDSDGDGQLTLQELEAVARENLQTDKVICLQLGLCCCCNCPSVPLLRLQPSKVDSAAATVPVCCCCCCCNRLKFNSTAAAAFQIKL